MKNKLLLVLSLLSLSSVLYAANVTQWGGTDRTSIYPEKNLQKKWQAEGPKLLWSSSEVGKGYSAGSIVGDNIYICGTTQDNKSEFLTVLNRQGKKLWSLDYGASWDKSFQDARIMPTIVGNDLFVISGAGEIVCIDLKAKQIKWKVDGAKEFGADAMAWGFAENPLVYKDKVFFTAGGKQTTVVALNIKDGSVVWKSPSLGVGTSYVSPIIANVNGKNQLIGAVRKWAFGIDPDTGKFIWQFELKKLGSGGMKNDKDWQISAFTPIFIDNKVFVTAGYDFGSYLIDISKSQPKEVWSNAEFDNHHGGAILIDGRLYGANWINNDKGNWLSVDFKTGKDVYNQEWQGHSKGSMTSADGMLYVYEEKRGDIALVNPKSDKFDVVSSFKVPLGKGRHWCHIVVCDGVMYVRHGNVLMAFDVKN